MQTPHFTPPALRLISNDSLTPKPPPRDQPCHHGFVFAGNCVKCYPPPAYKALRGNQTP